MITAEQAESAVKFYAEQGNELGRIRGQMEATKHAAKVLEHIAFCAASGTVSERQALAATDKNAIAKWKEHHDLVAEYETLRTHLKAAELRIEVWRTQNANARRGHV